MMLNRTAARFGRLITLLLFGVAALVASPGTSMAQTPDPSEIDASPELKPELIAVDSLRNAGAFRDAFGRLTSLKRDHPQNAEIHYRLALTRVDMGETSDSDQKRNSMYLAALENAKAALAADSMLAYSHLAAAIAEGRVALTAGTKEKIQRSRAVKHHADRAIELDPDMASAYHVRARWNREVADLGFFSRTIVRTVYGGLPEASFEQSVRDFKTAIEKE
ncbi:tetratricopeptide repeat protein, partial [Longibacter sp.]|uniref:tetratricopeptide repeat protein n=1 Tax=Longibacter sp. TaxID=2045415 RepID=UPI003EB89B05